MFADRIAQVIETRVRRPGQIAEAAAARTRAASVASARTAAWSSSRPTTRPAGRCGYAASGFAMADRAEPARAALRGARPPGVGGVLGTADVLEDLLLLGALQGRIVVASMNRGGLAGTVFEIGRPVHRIRRRGDRADGIRRRQDAAPDRPRRPGDGGAPCRRAPGPCPTWPGAGSSPWSSRSSPTGVDGRVRNDTSPEAMILALTIASGLGTTSAYTCAQGAGGAATWIGSWPPPPCPRCCSAARFPTTPPARSPGGGRALRLPTVRGCWPGGRCCTRPTATWPPLSTPARSALL